MRRRLLNLLTALSLLVCVGAAWMWAGTSSGRSTWPSTGLGAASGYGYGHGKDGWTLAVFLPLREPDRGPARFIRGPAGNNPQFDTWAAQWEVRSWQCLGLAYRISP